MRIPSKVNFVQNFNAFLTTNPNTLHTRREPFNSLEIDWFFEVNEKDKSAKFHLESQEGNYLRSSSLSTTLFPGDEPKLTFDFVLKYYGKNLKVDYRITDLALERVIPRNLENVDTELGFPSPNIATLLYRTYLDFILQKLKECKVHEIRPSKAAT